MKIQWRSNKGSVILTCGGAVFCGTALQSERFDSRWGHWNFLLTKSFQPHCVCKKNECQEYFLQAKGGRCVGLTTLPRFCADWLEIRGLNVLEPSGFLIGLYRDCYTFTFTLKHTKSLTLWAVFSPWFRKTVKVINYEVGRNERKENENS